MLCLSVVLAGFSLLPVAVLPILVFLVILRLLSGLRLDLGTSDIWHGRWLGCYWVDDLVGRLSIHRRGSIVNRLGVRRRDFRSCRIGREHHWCLTLIDRNLHDGRLL